MNLRSQNRDVTLGLVNNVGTISVGPLEVSPSWITRLNEQAARINHQMDECRFHILALSRLEMDWCKRPEGRLANDRECGGQGRS